MASMFSLYVGFQWIVGWLIFKENILVKNMVGTAVIIFSVLLSHMPGLFGMEAEHVEGESCVYDSTDKKLALMFGFVAPLSTSLVIVT